MQAGGAALPGERKICKNLQWLEELELSGDQ